MNIKEIHTEALAKEFMREEEYLRNVSYNEITDVDYNKKREYINSIREELANRGLGYAEIKQLAK